MSHVLWMDLTDAWDADSSIGEMEKKYANTYLVLITKAGDEIVVLYKGYVDGYHCFSDPDNVTLKLTQETDHQVVCIFPERKLFNFGGMALEFIRLPNRQFRRGVCRDNVKIYSPVKAMYNTDGHVWTSAMLTEALHSTYPATCEEAIIDLQKRTCLSIALSEKFMLSLSLDRKSPDKLMLFYMNKLIGYFLKDCFYIKHLLFKQEVLDNISIFKPYRIEF